MRREEMHERLKSETAGVRVSPALAHRVILAAQGKESVYMKKKISLAAAFALLAVALCAAALAAANRWGILDFVDRYAAEHYIPEDAQSYVQTDVAAMENDWVQVCVRELYYDGRISRLTVDVTPKEERTLIVGEDIFMEDPFVNLTNDYIEGGDNDMRPVYQVIEDEGIERVYSASVFMKGAEDDVVMGAGDYKLGEDGTLTIYSQEEYMTDMPEREASISVIVMPFDPPLDMNGRANYEKAAVLEAPVTLAASVDPVVRNDQAGGVTNVYVSESGADYPGAGVRVDRVTMEVKPMEIYATVEYTVTDRARFDAQEGGLWFEFIDPDKAGEPYEQRLAEGLTGGGAAGAVDHEAETPEVFIQRETLAKNELREVYALRAFNAWEKERYETREIRMIPIKPDGME